MGVEFVEIVGVEVIEVKLVKFCWFGSLWSWCRGC